MSDLLSKSWRLFAFLLFALVFFLGALFYYYRHGYDAPATVDVPYDQIAPPSSSFGLLSEVPAIRSGLLLIEGLHRNNFSAEELSALVSRVAARGYDVEILGETTGRGRFAFQEPEDRLSLLEERLRKAGSLVVVGARDSYTGAEAGLVARFVEKGGRLLLVADPTRANDMNSLSKRFGISFQPDYLYNMSEYDLNFQNVFIRDFAPDDLTRDLGQIALYTAGSIRSSGMNLAFTDGATRSSMLAVPERLSPLVKTPDGRVVGIADMTFMVPPRNSIMDNDRLLSNIADFLTGGDREFDLADFPYFLEQADILVGRASLIEAASQVRSLLSAFDIAAEVRGVEDITRDTVYIGLYEDARDVSQYLDLSGVRVTDVIRTPFTSDLPRQGTSIVVHRQTKDRDVLILLSDSEATLGEMIARFASGTFGDGLVDDSIGIYRSVPIE